MFDTYVEVSNLPDTRGARAAEEANRIGESSLQVSKDSLAESKKAKVNLTLDVQRQIRNMLELVDEEASKLDKLYFVPLGLRDMSYAGDYSDYGLDQTGRVLRKVIYQVQDKLKIRYHDLRITYTAGGVLVCPTEGRSVRWVRGSLPYTGLLPVDYAFTTDELNKLSNLLIGDSTKEMIGYWDEYLQYNIFEEEEPTILTF